jgi:hypothetical protein
MFPRLERFLSALAVAAIVVTAVFWAYPPELRFPDPRPEAGVSTTHSVEPPAAAAPPAAPLPAPPQPDVPKSPARSEPPVQAAAVKPEEAGQGLPAVISTALREALPEASLSDEQLRELTESVQAFRESMQTLRETERTPENAERIRELTGRVEENRQRFETTAGMSINDFLRRTTTDGIDNDRREEGKVVLETLDGAGR